MTLPVRLPHTVHEKVWGSPDTEPWSHNPDRSSIGEVWFEASDSVPLLVKFLFTSDNLSIQVHPGDAYAREHGHARGKTEMWHILRAEPGATVGLGLKSAITAERLREAALSGEIVELINWIPVKAGDTFLTPAGTVHGIGAGIALCEIQQLSDVTYRLYDYGRQPSRELHLEDSMAVAHLGEYEPTTECSYFRTERLELNGSLPIQERAMYIVLEGAGHIAGQPFQPGEVWQSSDSANALIESSGATLLVVTQP